MVGILALRGQRQEDCHKFQNLSQKDKTKQSNKTQKPKHTNSPPLPPPPQQKKQPIKTEIPGTIEFGPLEISLGGVPEHTLLPTLWTYFEYTLIG